MVPLLIGQTSSNSVLHPILSTSLEESCNETELVSEKSDEVEQRAGEQTEKRLVHLAWRKKKGRDTYSSTLQIPEGLFYGNQNEFVLDCH